jgi:hypothetical protein
LCGFCLPMTLWRTCSSATLGDGERSHPVVLSPTDLTSPSNARAQAIASLSDLNSKRHVTVASSVLHRKASGSKRWASSHSRIRAIIVDNSSCPRRISTTYNMPLLYSGTSLRRVNAGTEITAGRVLSARANPPCSMGVSCSPSPLPPRRAAKCGCSSLNVSSSYFAGPQHRLGWCSLHALEPSRA